MPHGERIRCVEQHGQPTHPDAPNWIENKPPARWPSFTKIPGKPRPVVKPGKALEMVAHVEQRWRDFKGGHAKEHPTIRETGAAMDALLTIDPSSPSFAAAWAAFVRLSKIDAEIGVYRRG
jgi:hypothetical protein